ncbi:hypothetical protein BDW67DRAFT_164172 [Aspergillus spinulosporus]
MLALTRLEPGRYILLVVLVFVLSNAAFYPPSVLSSEREKEKKKATISKAPIIWGIVIIFLHTYIFSPAVAVVVALLLYSCTTTFGRCSVSQCQLCNTGRCRIEEGVPGPKLSYSSPYTSYCFNLSSNGSSCFTSMVTSR